MNQKTSTSMRFNITLPADLGQKIKTRPNRSGLIAQSLREKFAREEQEKLDSILAKGYKASAAEDRQIAKEWDGVIGDGL